MPLAEAVPPSLLPSSLSPRLSPLPSYSFLFTPRWIPHNPPWDLLPVFFVSFFFLLSPSYLRDLPFDF